MVRLGYSFEALKWWLGSKKFKLNRSVYQESTETKCSIHISQSACKNSLLFLRNRVS